MKMVLFSGRVEKYICAKCILPYKAKKQLTDFHTPSRVCNSESEVLMILVAVLITKSMIIFIITKI